MALQKTQLLDITTVTGISTVGIFTAGVNQTPAGISSTTYIKGVILHSTGVSTCKASVFIYPDTNPVTGAANNSYRLLSIDLNPSETFSFETPYPIVLTGSDSVVIEINSTTGYTGIGSDVNVLLLGDTDITA